jgi:mRNA interferase MazF
MNQHLRTLIVAPLTSAIRTYPARVPVKFNQQAGQIALDQIRTVDKTRLVKKLGALNATTLRETLSVLVEMFSPA